MYTNLYVYTPPRLFMSGKLYWRIKKDGKWTWVAVTDKNSRQAKINLYYVEEEE